PSPRAWGSAGPRCRHPRSRRSIPTCVGLGSWGEERGPRVTVHPHVRGARVVGGGRVAGLSGPSPRAWGSVRTPFVTSDWMAVHPHVRGARSHHEIGDEEWDGPSPRAWGSVRNYMKLVAADRSIPTCVGLGSTWTRVLGKSSVHPHVRGARSSGPPAGRSTSVHPHVRGARARMSVSGLGPSGPSPRAWGSVHDLVHPTLGRRSIPTCVGLGSTRPTAR